MGEGHLALLDPQSLMRRVQSAPLLEEGPVSDAGRQTGSDHEERMLSNAPGGTKEGAMPLPGSGGCPEQGVVDKSSLWVS